MKWLLVFAAFQAALFTAVWQWARMPEAPPADGRALLAALREGKAASWDGPVIVQLWEAGRPRLRIEAANLDEAVRQFAAHRDQPGRLELSLVRARAPLPGRLCDRWPLLFALSAGGDGLALRVGAREVVLTPTDLMLAGALGGEHPLPTLDLDVGLDVGRTVALAVDRLGIQSSAYEAGPRTWSRVRVDTFVENAAPPDLTVDGPTLKKAARAAADYLVRHLAADGRYDYVYDPVADRVEQGGYSLPRHAGATFFVAQFGDPAAFRALEFLRKRSRKRGAVGESWTVDLGSAALSLIAAVEYQRTTGDVRFLPWMRELAGFLVYMQREDGDFRHYYQPDPDTRDEKTRAPYYSGEASLALARLANLLGADGKPYAAAAERGVDYLIGPYYDFFLGQFIYAEDHWTCMAADALADHISPDKLRRYARFCDGFATFLRRMQYTPADAITAAHPDFAGAYGFGSILPPHTTPAGSRSECLLSVLRLDRRAGLPTGEVEAQIRRSMQFLLSMQFGGDHRFPHPEKALGGIPFSDVNLSVRIDGVQHVGSAMLRASEVW
jgi:hypothetical protein